MGENSGQLDPDKAAVESEAQVPDTPDSDPPSSDERIESPVVRKRLPYALFSHPIYTKISSYSKDPGRCCTFLRIEHSRFVPDARHGLLRHVFGCCRFGALTHQIVLNARRIVAVELVERRLIRVLRNA